MGEHILVVEDDKAMVEGIRDALEMSGYEVGIAENGEVALNYLGQRVPDLIVSDIMMPKVDGYELLEHVRRNPDWVSIPFIFLTSKSEKSDIRKGFAMGAESYLPKPFEEEDLQVAVRARLDRARQIQKASRFELNDLKNRILNLLSHEFRTPLTYITGYADLLQDENLTPEQLRQFLGGLHTGGTRLHNLVEDFLFLVSLQTDDAGNAYVMQRDYFNDWADLVDRVFVRYAEASAARHVTLECEVVEPLPSLMLHVAYLEDVLSRLVSNAIKFTPEEDGGRVQVRIETRDGGVLISISDEGIGIPAAQMSIVFEPFYQIDRDKHEQQGAGVGLAIVKGIVELHGGWIAIENHGHRGSVFSVWLPHVDESNNLSASRPTGVK